MIPSPYSSIPSHDDISGAAKALELAEAVAAVGHWQFDFMSGRVFWSDEVYRIHGVTRETFDPNLEAVLNSYHPDDRPSLISKIDRAQRSGEGYELKLRIRRFSDRAERIVVAKAIVRVNGEGDPASLFGVLQDVTDEELLKQRVSESEADFRLLAETAPDIISRYQFDGTFTYISPALMGVLGYHPDEFIGRKTFELIDPDDHARVLDQFRRYIRQGPLAPPTRIEYRAIHKDGSTVWLEAHPRAVFDAQGRVEEFFDVGRDVTARKEMELIAQAAIAEAERARDQAADSGALYRLLTEHSMDVIMKMRPEGEIRYCSPASRHFGYEPEEVTGQNMAALVHPDDLPGLIADIVALYGDARPEAQLTREQRVLTKSGEYVWVEGNSTLVFNERGEPTSTVTLLRDITARRAMEDDLRRAKDGAEAAAQAKTDFLANMSHELRTPLTSVIGFSGLLRELPDLPPLARQYIQRIGAASTSLLSLINDVLDFSKLESNQLLLDPHLNDVREIATEVCDVLSIQANAKNIAIRRTCDPLIPERIDVDDVRLRQILFNLIGNAVKFTEAGEVSVDLAMAGSTAEPRLRVEVRDTGPGLSNEQQTGLFQRFSQVDASITRTHGGSGLGLSICRQLVERMGGKIGVESELGHGSCFWFEVLSPVATTAIAADSPPLEEPVFTSSSRILVVDDHPANRELLRALLDGFGFEIDAAASGQEAVEACLQNPYDVILMDVQMPGMDGMAATKAIRASCDPNLSTPVIALTGLALEDRKADFQRAGMNDWLGKPIDTKALYAKLDLWLTAAGDADEESALSA